MSAPISILLVDDHGLVRDTLRLRLDAESDMTVVGVADNAGDGLRQAMDLRPRIVLMDIDMPGQSCFAAVRDLKVHCPQTRVIYLSAFSNDRYIDDALASHAWGYVTKDEPADVIVKAIRLAASGSAYFSPKVQSRMVVDTRGIRLSRSGKSRASLLSTREVEVVRYLARGMTHREIAKTMHIAVKTVDKHCSNLMSKLDIHDRVELARFAFREGLSEA